MHHQKLSGVFFFSCFLLLFVTACAVTPPVQEMSNARQTIQAARDAGAETYADKLLKEAERLLEQASEEIDNKDYFSAKISAHSAQEQAMQARQVALQKSRNK